MAKRTCNSFAAGLDAAFELSLFELFRQRHLDNSAITFQSQVEPKGLCIEQADSKKGTKKIKATGEEKNPANSLREILNILTIPITSSRASKSRQR